MNDPTIKLDDCGLLEREREVALMLLCEDFVRFRDARMSGTSTGACAARAARAIFSIC